jgi:hypothetical protein
MDQRRVRDELVDSVEVIAPDRLCERGTSLVQLEAPSVRASTTACRPTSRADGARAIGDRICIATVDAAEEFLGLAMKLLQTGPDGQPRPRWSAPRRLPAWKTRARSTRRPREGRSSA